MSARISTSAGNGDSEEREDPDWDDFYKTGLPPMGLFDSTPEDIIGSVPKDDFESLSIGSLRRLQYNNITVVLVTAVTSPKPLHLHRSPIASSQS